MSLPQDLNAREYSKFVEGVGGGVGLRLVPSSKEGMVSLLGIDSGVLNTVSDAIDISEFKKISVQVVQASGTITGLVTTLQYSNDGVTWFTSAVTIAAATFLDNTETHAKYVRFKATTASTLASTANYYLQGK